MPRDSRGHRHTSNGPLLSLATTPSSSTSSIRPSEGGSIQPPGSQHLIIQRPSTLKKRKDKPHHNPNPEKDVSKQLRVWSYRDKRSIEISAIFVHDLDDQCWISEDAVERLNLRYTSILADEYGVLARKTFEFCGTVTLHWIDNCQSKPTTCRIVPRNSGIKFEVLLPNRMLAPEFQQEGTETTSSATSNNIAPSVEEYSTSTSLSVDFVGSFDGQGLDDAEFMNDSSNEAKWADEWMSELKKKVHKRWPPGYVRDADIAPVKIAVLDTGIDMQHTFIKGCKKLNRIKDFKSFVKGDHKLDDTCGHGTHVAALLMRVAPEAQIYVAKVATGNKIPSDHRIAEALEWAISEEVDIITMSFGMDNDHLAMQDQILEAYRRNIIMFAAASNSGQNEDVTFPARENEVICVYSTDGMGNKSPCNPACLTDTVYHFATVGAAVKSSWPRHLLRPAATSSSAMAGVTQQASERTTTVTATAERPSERRMTGTSFATPILAGVAAYVLDFVRTQGIQDNLYQRLRCRRGMQELFATHMSVKDDKLDYIRPWKLFADHLSNEEILSAIEGPLKRAIGSSERAEVF